jgi:ribonuclease HII
MPWVVGIDEAGYGPNLGPLVQAAIGLYLPGDDPAGWETLRPVVRRCHEDDDGRLLIDDSKKVYSRHGLEALERGVRTMPGPICHDAEEMVRKIVSSECRDHIAREVWFEPGERLPVTYAPEEWFQDFIRFGERLAELSEEIKFCSTEANVVPARQFNQIVDQTSSKGAVVALGLVSLMKEVSACLRAGTTGDSPVTFLCDKLGGKNYYAALVQQAFPDGWVVAEKESAAESRYRVEGLDRPVSVVFRPRSDAESVAVALASMLAKYLREVCMRQFNRFWARHVPGIQPTAGYPGDARRFYAEIRDAMVKIGLSDDQVWRKR